MIQIDYKSGQSICDQVVNGFIRLKVLGVLKENDQLPSVRALASQLAVNPNTVQKAYKLLEDEGLILSHPGAGSTIIIDEQRKQAIRAELTAAEIKQTIRSLRSLGLDKAAALSLIDKNWEESE